MLVGISAQPNLRQIGTNLRSEPPELIEGFHREPGQRVSPNRARSGDHISKAASVGSLRALPLIANDAPQIARARYIADEMREEHHKRVPGE